MELLLELSNLPSYHSLYMTLLIGLMVRILWIWSIQHSLIPTIYESDDLHLQAPSNTLEMKRLLVQNPLLLWITKFIRRKEGSSDDTDSFPLVFLV